MITSSVIKGLAIGHRRNPRFQNTLSLQDCFNRHLNLEGLAAFFFPGKIISFRALEKVLVLVGRKFTGGRGVRTWLSVSDSHCPASPARNFTVTNKWTYS
jgi:hypothetical protein